METTEYTIRAIPSIKKYTVGCFDSNFEFSKNLKSPISMYREKEKEVEEEAENPELVPGHMAYRKKKRRRFRSQMVENWIIEEDGQDKKYIGNLQGGQKASYMCFMLNEDKNEFQMVPIEDWFKFKKPLNYRTLTLDEAEDLNSEKNRKVERWLMKHKSLGNSTDEMGNNLFIGSKSSEYRTKSKPKETNEGVSDFQEKFDDDESEAEVDNTVSNVVVEESDESDNEASLLSSTGQAMKDLLKRQQKGDLKNSKEEDDENFVIKHDLGGNVIRVKKTTSGEKRSIDQVGDVNEGGDKSKKVKTTPSKESNRLSEASVQNMLQRYGGRMKTRDLLKKLKKQLNTSDDKALLRDILRTICTVEEDAVDGRMVVLKSQFM